jgi:hypothetical protein
VTETDFIYSGEEHEVYQPLGVVVDNFPTSEVGDTTSRFRITFSAECRKNVRPFYMS